MEDWKNDRANAEMIENDKRMMAEAKEKRIAEELKESKKIETIKLSLNTRESFDVNCINKKDETVIESHGYMPDWFHGYNYGSMELEIDNATGKILNWKPLDSDEIKNKTEDY